MVNSKLRNVPSDSTYTSLGEHNYMRVSSSELNSRVFYPLIATRRN